MELRRIDRQAERFKPSPVYPPKLGETKPNERGFNMKYTEINGRRFQIVNSWTKEGETITQSLKWCKDWTDLYTKPSTTKQEIKEDWEKWASESNHYHVIILGYQGGVQTFSIYGTIDGDPFKITPTRNIIVV